MKRSSILIVLILCLFLVTACNENKTQKQVISNGETVDTSKMQHKTCTRDADAGNGIDVTLSYDLYYTGENLNILHSSEKVVATSNDTLDEYENAYKKIDSNYENLKYYDSNVIRGDTSVTRDLTINYDKIDIDGLLAIEGEEDNIIENGKAKVDKWLTLAKKFGTKCEDVNN